MTLLERVFENREVDAIGKLYAFESEPPPEASHVVRVYDLMKLEEFSVKIQVAVQMELCDGSLVEYLRELRAQKETISAQDICDIFIQILHGLQYCHSKGLCHRDIKPQNGMSAPLKRIDNSTIQT
jgi:serine/threonine protein kinase